MPHSVKHLFVLTPVDHRDRGMGMAGAIMAAQPCSMQRVFATSSGDNDTYQTLYGFTKTLNTGEERTRHDCLRDGDIDACVKLVEETDYSVVILLTHTQFATLLVEKCGNVLFGKDLRLGPITDGQGWYLTKDNVQKVAF